MQRRGVDLFASYLGVVRPDVEETGQQQRSGPGFVVVLRERAEAHLRGDPLVAVVVGLTAEVGGHPAALPHFAGPSWTARPQGGDRSRGEGGQVHVGLQVRVRRVAMTSKPGITERQGRPQARACAPGSGPLSVADQEGGG